MDHQRAIAVIEAYVKQYEKDELEARRTKENKAAPKQDRARARSFLKVWNLLRPILEEIERQIRG